MANFIYVNDDAKGKNNGASWTNAYTDMQDAIKNVKEGDRLLVAQGTYKPSVNNTSLAFELTITGVGIYGGFIGDENITPENFETILEQRNFQDHETILSGDLGTPGDNNDNSETLIKIDNGFSTPDQDITIDGFTVTAANGNSGIYYRNYASDSNTTGNTTFKNLVIKDNISNTSGGGIYFEDHTKGKQTLENITFENNFAISQSSSLLKGGGLYLYAEDFTQDNPIDLVNVKFINNKANVNKQNSLFDYNYGGAIYIQNGGYVRIFNGLFYKNQATKGGGINLNSSGTKIDITNSTFVGNIGSEGSVINNSSDADVTIRNSILWGNENTPDNPYIYPIQNDNVKIDNATIKENQDPKFIDADKGDFRLLPDSPGIDAGENSNLVLNPQKPEDLLKTDLDGGPRIVNKRVDLGAYEFQPLLFINNIIISEPEKGQTATAKFTVTLQRPETFTEAVRVNYATTPKVKLLNKETKRAQSGRDFEATKGTLRFKTGETTKTISVTINSDNRAETDEIFRVRLTKPRGGIIVGKLGDEKGTGIATITDSGKQQQSARVDSLIGDVDSLAGKSESFATNRDVVLAGNQELITQQQSLLLNSDQSRLQNSPQPLELDHFAYGGDYADKVKTQDQELMNISHSPVDI